MVTLSPLSVFCTAKSCVHFAVSVSGVLPALNVYMVPGPIPNARALYGPSGAPGPLSPVICRGMSRRLQQKRPAILG